MTIEDSFNFVRVSDRVTTSGSVSEPILRDLGAEGYEAVINLLPNSSPHAVAGEAEIVTGQGLDYVLIEVDFADPTAADFDAFSHAMDQHHGRVVHVHCAANYRVSAFYGLYALQQGSWSAAEADEYVSSIWNPTGHEPWSSFVDSTRERVGRLGALPLDHRVRVMRREIDRIADRLGDLEPAQLDQPAIGDWTIREVVAHLALVAEFYTSSIQRGASGDASAAGSPVEAGTGRGEVASDSIREGAAKRARADARVIGQFRGAALGLADALIGDETDLAYDCYHPGGIVPANRFLVLYLKELGLHEWDMFEAIEPPCAMSRWGVDAAFQAIEEELASGSLRWVTDPALSPETATIRVMTRGTVGGQRDLVLEPDGTRLMAIDEARSVDGLLVLDAADFVLGCSGRGDLVAVVAGGRGEGDIELARMLARRLTGM